MVVEESALVSPQEEMPVELFCIKGSRHDKAESCRISAYKRAARATFSN